MFCKNYIHTTYAKWPIWEGGRDICISCAVLVLKVQRNGDKVDENKELLKNKNFMELLNDVYNWDSVVKDNKDERMYIQTR
jgi:hypothetical protein